MPSSGSHPLITAQYDAARVQLGNSDALILLRVDEEQTAIAVGRGATPDATLTLAIGTQKTAKAHFKHTPPSPLELEKAIATVEDEVTRAKTLMPTGARLVTTDRSLRDIALLSGLPSAPAMRLPLDTMERTFDRMVQRSLGYPASFDRLPAGNDFAARLLILREFMHHLQFADITLLQVDHQYINIDS